MNVRKTMPNLAKKISLLVLLSTLFTLLVGINPARAEINNEFSLAPAVNSTRGIEYPARIVLR